MMIADNPTTALRIGGYQPFTTVDYPGALAAVVFCQGCPLRCVYCHNRDLLPAWMPSRVDWNEVYAHLTKRRDLLDAVVFSGGEPLMQKALPSAMKAAKELGYKIGLHTSGIAPNRLRSVLPFLDWVGFDVKAPFGDYEKVTGVKGSGEKACQSLAILAAAEIDVEVRTTIWPDCVDVAELSEILEHATQAGIRFFAVQEARDPIENSSKGGAVFTDFALQKTLAKKFEKFTVRHAAP